MANFVTFLRFIGHKMVILRDIALQIAENMQLGSKFRINLVSLENIDIWPSYGPKRLQKFQLFHIWAYAFCS